MNKFEAVWQSLPTDLFTSQNKGSKAEARKEWEKIKVDDKIYNEIIDFLKAKEEVDRMNRKTEQFTAPWPHFCRLLKRRFWEDDKPVPKRGKKACAPTKCRECSNPVDHGGYQLCWTHYDDKFGNTLTGHGVQL
jgi:hypothetical protein